jgi:hypothetical protein
MSVTPSDTPEYQLYCFAQSGNAYLFPDHESPPSLPRGDRDSEVAVIFNDGSD